jgi:hypothetical protein
MFKYIFLAIFITNSSIAFSQKNNLCFPNGINRKEKDVKESIKFLCTTNFQNKMAFKSDSSDYKNTGIMENVLNVYDSTRELLACYYFNRKDGLTQGLFNDMTSAYTTFISYRVSAIRITKYRGKYLCGLIILYTSSFTS